MKERKHKKLKEKKVFALSGIYLMISLTIATAYFMGIGSAESIYINEPKKSLKDYAVSFLDFLLPSVSAATGCCVKTSTNEYCVNDLDESLCSEDLFFAGSSCSAIGIDGCETGTCIEEDGSCSGYKFKKQCEDGKGFFVEDSIENVQECQSACCIYKDSEGNIVNAEWKQYSKRCEVSAEDYGLDYELDYNSDPYSCAANIPSETKGYCWLATECFYGKKSDCPEEGVFSSQKRCPNCQEFDRLQCGEDGNVHKANECGEIGDLVETCSTGVALCKNVNSTFAQCEDIRCEVRITETTLNYDAGIFEARTMNVEGPRGISGLKRAGDVITLEQGESACLQYNGPGESHSIVICNNDGTTGVLSSLGLDAGREKICIYDANLEAAKVKDNAYEKCGECKSYEFTAYPGAMKTIVRILGADLLNPEWFDYWWVKPGRCDNSKDCEALGDCSHVGHRDCVPSFPPGNSNLCLECSSTEASSPWLKCNEDVQCESRGYCKREEHAFPVLDSLGICTLETVVSSSMKLALGEILKPKDQEEKVAKTGQETKKTKQTAEKSKTETKWYARAFNGILRGLKTAVDKLTFGLGDDFIEHAKNYADNFFGWTKGDIKDINEKIAEENKKLKEIATKNNQGKWVPKEGHKQKEIDTINDNINRYNERLNNYYTQILRSNYKDTEEYKKLKESEDRIEGIDGVSRLKYDVSKDKARLYYKGEVYYADKKGNWYSKDDLNTPLRDSPMPNYQGETAIYRVAYNLEYAEEYILNLKKYSSIKNKEEFAKNYKSPEKIISSNSYYGSNSFIPLRQKNLAVKKENQNAFSAWWNAQGGVLSYLGNKLKEIGTSFFIGMISSFILKTLPGRALKDIFSFALGKANPAYWIKVGICATPIQSLYKNPEACVSDPWAVPIFACFIQSGIFGGMNQDVCLPASASEKSPYEGFDHCYQCNPSYDSNRPCSPERCYALSKQGDKGCSFDYSTGLCMPNEEALKKCGETASTKIGILTISDENSSLLHYQNKWIRTGINWTSNSYELNITTNKYAECRISKEKGISFDKMISISEKGRRSLDGTQHIISLNIKSRSIEEANFSYFVQCQDICVKASRTPLTEIKLIKTSKPDEEGPLLDKSEQYPQPDELVPGDVDGKTNVLMKVVTDEKARCYYGRYKLAEGPEGFAEALNDYGDIGKMMADAGKSEEEIVNALTGLASPNISMTPTQKGRVHSESLQNLENGKTYAYIIKCNDSLEHESDPTVVRFKVSEYFNIDILSPKGSVNDPQPSIEAKTDRAAKCRYAFKEMPYDNMISFDESGGTEHKAYLENELIYGSHTLYVKCLDEIGNNIAEKRQTFSIEKGGPPQIIRAYYDSGTLYIGTNARTSCQSSLKEFSYGEGQEMTGNDPYSRKHRVDWIPDTLYYIKCIDNFGNALSARIRTSKGTSLSEEYY